MTLAILLSAMGCALAGGALGYAWPHLRERLRSRRTRRLLGRPCALDPGLDQELVTLRGTLRSDGAGPAATTTSRFPTDPLATSARSRRLQLEIGEAMVDLDGAVEVMVGSEELPFRLASELALASRPATRRVLHSSDPVMVRGRLRVSHGDFTGYRLSNTRYTLRPPSSADAGPGDTLSLASTRLPRQRGAHLSLMAAGAVTGALLSLLGYGIASVLTLPVIHAQEIGTAAAPAEPYAPEESKPMLVLSDQGVGDLTAHTPADFSLLRDRLNDFYVCEVPAPSRGDGSIYVVTDRNRRRVMMLEAGMRLIARAEIYSRSVRTEDYIGVGTRSADLFIAHPDTTCMRNRWRQIAPAYGNLEPLSDVVTCTAPSLPRITLAFASSAAKEWEGDLYDPVDEFELDPQAKIVRVSYDLLR